MVERLRDYEMFGDFLTDPGFTAHSSKYQDEDI